MTHKQTELFGGPIKLPTAAEARAAGRAGAELAAYNAGKAWQEYAVSYGTVYAKNHPTWFADEVWDSGLEEPPPPANRRAIGLPMKHLLGKTQPVALHPEPITYRPSRQQHGKHIAVYRSNLYPHRLPLAARATDTHRTNSAGARPGPDKMTGTRPHEKGRTATTTQAAETRRPAPPDVPRRRRDQLAEAIWEQVKTDRATMAEGICEVRWAEDCPMIAAVHPAEQHQLTRYTRHDVHHIHQRQHGGPDTIGNVVYVCRPCHARIHSHPRPRGRARMVAEGLEVRR